MTDSQAFGGAAPMEGHGAYNRSSRVQAAGLSPALTLFKQAARIVPLFPAPQPLVIADYGSSEGHNSFGPLSLAIGELRKRLGSERAISIVHTDLPDNDFRALFQTLATDSESYLRDDPAVFASAIGRSFYRQILPSDSVTLGWSSWAMQWLSRVPAPIPDQLQIAFSQDQGARAAFKKHAADDWQTFLTHRGRELRPGGRLVVLTMALDEHGNFGYRPLLEAMYAALMEMAEGGVVHREEALRMVIPTVARSRADLLTPFEKNGSFGDLSIEHLEVFRGEDRIWAEFQASNDALAFGSRWAAFSRASVFPSLTRGLDGGLGDPRTTAFIERLESGMAARLAMAPEPVLIPLAKILLVKGPRA